MATVITASAQDYLEALAEELAITDARYKQAETSYESLGEWLGRPASTIAHYDPAVFVQGSFGLGTVIKPLHDEEEYDIDAVCEFQGLEKDDLTQAQLKEMLRVELEDYRTARKIAKPLEESRRCWTLRYADEAQFHMDIVPALADADTMRMILEASHQDTRWTDTAIAITDNERVDYGILTHDWPHSNPAGYLQWFKTRMAPILQKRKKELAEAAQASVESIPDYRVRTPLQASIMILKRHRDVMYVKDEINACPISIIITTLAAHAYGGEEKIADALVSILGGMEDHIGIDDAGNDFIANPTDPRENFADKWIEHPERRAAFYEWLAQAQEDFRTAATLGERRLIRETLEKHIGSDLAKRAETRSGNRAGGLLRPAAAAAAAAALAAPSFENVARTPTKPQGFA
jgi:hypothetical protein